MVDREPRTGCAPEARIQAVPIAALALLFASNVFLFGKSEPFGALVFFLLGKRRTAPNQACQEHARKSPHECMMHIVISLMP